MGHIYNSGFVTLFFFQSNIHVHFAHDKKMQKEFKDLVQYV